MYAQQLAMIAAGIFFLTALLAGVWKYRCIMSSPEAKAPVYVDLAHRTALMYSFAAILLAEFASRSAWPDTVNLFAVLAPIVFFAAAIMSYVLHGLLRDTDNQFRAPHRLGSRILSSGVVRGHMTALIVAEIGGFVVLFAGYLKTLVG